MQFFNILDRQKTLNLQKWENLFVVGCGGIGAWVTFIGALSSCFNNIIVWDPDKVESTNLNRTPFKLTDINNLKVDAIGKLIEERRIENLTLNTLACRFDDSECEKLNMMSSLSVLVDCRDGIFDDIKKYNGRVIKVNYDGLSVTYDGNPKERIIWGQRQGTYNIVPSFVCPALFIANLVVSEICTRAIGTEYKELVTFDISEIKRRSKNVT